MSQSPLFHTLYQERVARRRVRGGWRNQRGALPPDDAEADVPAETTTISKLALGLLQEWCDGISSAVQLWRHASNAVHDGLKDKLLIRLAAISSSSSTQHCNEGMRKILDDLPLMQHITPIVGCTLTCCVKPSALLGLICDNYPREFRLRLGADTSVLREFWEGMYNSPFRRNLLAEHPLLGGLIPAVLTCAIPLTLHEDAGPCSKGLGANALSYSSVVANASEKVVKLLFASGIKQPGRNIHKTYDVWLEDVLLLFRTGIRCRKTNKLWEFILLFAKADEECRAIQWGCLTMAPPNPAASACATGQHGLTRTCEMLQLGSQPK